MRGRLSIVNSIKLGKLRNPIKDTCGDRRSFDLSNPADRAKYNTLLKQKQQITATSKDIQQQTVLSNKRKKEILELNSEILKQVETEREKLIVSNLLRYQERMLEKLSTGKFAKFPTDLQINERDIMHKGIYYEVLNSVLKKQKRLKPGELESIFKTINKSLIEIEKHMNVLVKYYDQTGVNVKLYDAIIRKLFKSYTENEISAPELIKTMTKMTALLKRAETATFPVGDPMGTLVGFAKQYKINIKI